MIVNCTHNHRIAAKCEIRIENANTANSVCSEFETHSADHVRGCLETAASVVSAAVGQVFPDQYFDFFLELLRSDVEYCEDEARLCKAEVLATSLLDSVTKARVANRLENANGKAIA